MFFNGWMAIINVIVMGVTSYLALIAILRVSGKRTLSKLNMFDFIITIAIGSAFATVVFSKDIALAEGVVGIGVLVALQYVVARLSVRSATFQQIVTGNPTLLYYRGQYLREAMRQEGITDEDLRFIARAARVSDMSQVAAIILETDGSCSLIPNISGMSRDSSVLQGVRSPTHD